MARKEPPSDCFVFRWGGLEINISGRLAIASVAGLILLAAGMRFAGML